MTKIDVVIKLNFRPTNNLQYVLACFMFKGILCNFANYIFVNCFPLPTIEMENCSAVT